MKVIFIYIWKVFLYTIICYSILLLVALPFVSTIKREISNNLTLILIQESSFLISGFIVIIISKLYFKETLIIFKPLRALVYYLSILFLIVIFCWILYIFDIVDFVFYKIININSFEKFLIFCAIPTLFIAFGEEFIFRWFLLNRLKTFLNTNTAVVISSLVFCLGHNWNLPNMLFAFTGACLFSMVYIYTNSIFNCIGIHSAWNFGQRFFFEGMSDFSYEAQRIVLLDIKNIDKYNWAEFYLFAVLLISFLIFFNYKYRKRLINF